MSQGLWNNPLFSMEERLEIAKGAINFRDKIIKNLRERLEISDSALANISKELVQRKDL